ncbi:beta-glucosidase [Phycicoccus endophyticus]|uniref:Beta-glucosidase n=1 Tax=Phycicoccus endophyticus TaxID=1690220 RepID=A0A7G9QZ40_9MICO|nr:GH1 family beta-glucosidase [Phycicoccus endophyticus]NHI18959.1 beta-glucosidase [Phycicoccus endophyticus]QNN48615.1 beta-glucosidase [Phycicoccus endophyticus]GGL31703.1 beta-glucosidase [Phycicoccus endophyticus]
MTSSALSLPDGFLFGAATASYQIEGAVTEDGRGPSIWDTFSAVPGNTANGDTGEVACDHYHRVPEDVALMRDLGLDAYRFSVAWPRILPQGVGTPNQPGIDFYDRLVDELLAAGIRPVATLYHWDLPQALEDRGGWRTREVAGWFADYAAVVVGALGDRVRNWTTLNEPWCSSMLSHTLGAHAPGHRDPLEGLLTAHHLMLAHGTAVPVIREHCPEAEVSVTLNPSQVHGPQDPTEADLDAVRRADNVLNGVFFGPIFHGAYPEGFLDDVAHLTDGSFVHDGDLDTISAPLDNLGVNNYFPTRVRATADGEEPEGDTHLLPGCERVSALEPHPPLTAMGWEQSPESHRMILERSARECGLPVYVTENGSAWDDTVAEDGQVHDPERVAYLRAHLAAVADAVDAGADVRGYFAWSLLDNFEWAYGYDKRFGIVHVDYATQVRTVKDSGREYARIIAEHHGR